MFGELNNLLQIKGEPDKKGSDKKQSHLRGEYGKIALSL